MRGQKWPHYTLRGISSMFGGRKQKADTKRYYDLLAIDKTANDDDIRKAYKQKSRELHPDRNGGSAEAQAKFVEMKMAYDVLSEPHKRAIYDKAGEEGLKAFEDMSSINPEQMMQVMASGFAEASCGDRLRMIFVLALFFGFLLLGPIFLCLKLDSLSWNWSVVFIPFWVLDFVFGCCAFQSIFSNPIPEEGETIDSTAVLLGKTELAATYLLFVAQQILLVLRLSNAIDNAWSAVLLPSLLLTIVWLLVAAIRYSRPPPEAAESSKVWSVRSLFSMLSLLLQIIFVCLVMAKLDGEVSASWWTVWLPVWLWVFISLIKHLRLYTLMKTEQELKAASKPASTGSTDAHDAATREDEDEDKDMQVHPGEPLAAMCCIGFWVVLPSILIVLKIDGGNFSSFLFFLPVFICAGCAFCGCCCFVLCASNLQEEDDEEGEEGEEEDLERGVGDSPDDIPPPAPVEPQNEAMGASLLSPDTRASDTLEGDI